MHTFHCLRNRYRARSHAAAGTASDGAPAALPRYVGSTPTPSPLDAPRDICLTGKTEDTLAEESPPHPAGTNGREWMGQRG